MKRYLKLFIAFARNCLLREMESRGNFFAECLVLLLFPFLPLLFVGAIFSQVADLGGWSFNEYLVLVGTFSIINALVFTLFFRNIFEFPERVRKGELDFYLLKPMNSQFMLSLRYVNFPDLSPLLPGIVLVFIGLSNLTVKVEWWQWLLYPVFITCGVIIAYSIWFITTLPSIWTVRLDVHEIFFTVFEIGRYAPSMFKGVLQFVLTYLLPFGIIASTPANLLINRLTWESAGWLMLCAALLLWLSSLCWKFAQTRYYGASS